MTDNLILKKVVKAAVLVFALAMMVTFAVPSANAYAAGKVKSVKVTNLPAKTLTLKKGATKKLKVKVTRTSTSVSKAVTFTSSKEKVATVNEKGKIKAIKKGTTKITVASVANPKKKTVIKVTVGTPAKKVKLNETTATVVVGSKIKLKATVTPKKASNRKVVWKTSKKSVATVTKKGYVKGIKSGTATITAVAADGSGKKAKCKVTVKDPVKISSITADVNKNCITVKLTDKCELTKADFKVDKKQIYSGSYLYTATVDRVETTDNVTYKVYLSSEDGIYDEYVRVTVSNLFGTGTDSREVYAAITGEEITDEVNYGALVGDDVSYCLGYNDFGDVFGYVQVTVNNLPEGTYFEKSSSYGYIRGTFEKKGTFKSTIEIKDELGNRQIITFNWYIADETCIMGYMNDVYTKVYGDEYSDYVYMCPNVIGGSGSYTYAFKGNSYGLDINEYGDIYGSMETPGTYTITIEVKDAADGSISKTLTAKIYVTQAYKVTGKIKNKNGEPITSGEVYFSNTKTEYYFYDHGDIIYYDDNGSYEVYLVAGTYDVEVYYAGQYIDIGQVTVSADKTYNINLSVALTTITTYDLTVEYDYTYYEFTPTKDGTYCFYTDDGTDGGYETDTRGCLYAGSEYIASNDDGGNGWQFAITYECKAGQTYRIGVSAYSYDVGNEVKLIISSVE